VASQWRIRHKLMLGLILVVGVMALLLGGTLHGLWSYWATIQSIKSKDLELKQAEDLKDAIITLKNSVERFDPAQPKSLNDAIVDANEKLNAYDAQLDKTLQQGYYDPNMADHSRDLVVHLKEGLGLLDNEFHTLIQPKGEGMKGDREMTAGSIKVMQGLVDAMERQSGELREVIHAELERNIEGSRRHYQVPIWIITPASLGGLLLVCGLIRACYAWVVYPLRDLEGGVTRVAQGDFEHRIKLNSGDEMQDLAEAFNDMTQRLQTLYNDLARQVNERSRQLVRSEKLASVGFLAAGVAHEINNPLASIAFCSEALEARLASLMRFLPTSAQKGDDLEVFMRYLKMIQEEAFRCKTITEKLLDFSRNGEKRREPTDLGQLIQSVLDITQHLPNSKGKKIAFESQTERLPGGRITAPVNAEEIKSVVLNLVVNALDSMEDDGQLTIRLALRDGMAEMRFIDTGCGMSQEVLENIFEPFFTRSRTGKGTGLGLTISHRIINQHGGDVEAASPGPNQGSTFTVRLPIQIVESNTPLEPRGTARSLAA